MDKLSSLQNKLQELRDNLASDLEKSDGPKKGSSVFTMSHVNEVTGMKHGDAKAHAHGIVDASSATAANKTKIKKMIDTSKSSAHLATGMSNHILAHPGEGLKVI